MAHGASRRHTAPGARWRAAPGALWRRSVRWHRARPARAVICDPKRGTTVDPSGAVRSVQAADITLPAERLERLWTPEYLERLARAYWRYLSRISLGIIRVRYSATERAIVLLAPLVLLRFAAPEYRLGSDGGAVRWTIRDGLLVAKRARNRGTDSYLEIEVQRRPCEEPGMARARVRVEVVNFHPAILAGISSWAYRVTQSRIHVLITHGFLRSLTRLDFPASAVGRFAPGDAPSEPTTV